MNIKEYRSYLNFFSKKKVSTMFKTGVQTLFLESDKTKKVPSKRRDFLSRWRDSNPRPADYKSAALAS